MANTFLVLRNNDTSPQLFFHDGQNISPTGLGALPAATLEDLTSFGGSRVNVKHNNRVFTFLDMIFVLQNGIIFVSTDEGATFTADFTFTGATATFYMQAVGPVPVMIQGALFLVGFYLSGNDIFVFTYDFALDAWADADTGINTVSNTAGATLPVVHNGLVHARVGDKYIAYDPVSTGTVTLLAPGLGVIGSDAVLAWNGDLWLGPVFDAGVFSGMAKLQGASWDLGVGGIDLGVASQPSGSAKAGVFIDPVTSNLIVMFKRTGAFEIIRVTPGLVVTNITGTVKGPALTTLGNFGNNTRVWPHVTRAPGGTYAVTIYASRGPDTTDPIECFEWVDDATQITEVGIVGGSGDMAFPYAIHGGDYNGFFAGEKRTIQTAQSAISTGINVTCEAYQQGGTTFSVRGHFDNVGVSPNALTLDPLTLSNPTGTGGLAVSGGNPGAQVDGVPANRTPVSFDWDQVTDGFVTGDNFNFQLEAL